MRVLVLSQRLPYAPNRGDRVRVYHMLREVGAHVEVDVAALVHDAEEESHAVDLRGIAGEVITARVPRARNLARAAAALPGPVPLTHILLAAPALVPALTALVSRRRPDVTLAFCSSMARFALEPPLSSVPCVIDMIDADSAKWAALAEAARAPMRWIYRREARLLGGFEALVIQKAFMTLVVNQKERDALDALSPHGRIQIIENGVDVASFAPRSAPAPSATVVFCGVMNYGPNVQGAVWLATEVWPIVRAARADARLVIVGASPSSKVAALASQASGIVVTGAVADVRPYLWDAAVAAAPLHIARGVQNKVLEAVAAGLPCVVTGAVAEGLPGEIAPACRVGNTAHEFAGALTALLARSPEERRAIALHADFGHAQWSARLRPLMPLLEAAAGTAPR